MIQPIASREILIVRKVLSHEFFTSNETAIDAILYEV